jgi:hypothetical protein
MLIVETIARIFGRAEMTCDPWHYVPVLARKPGATHDLCDEVNTSSNVMKIPLLDAWGGIRAAAAAFSGGAGTATGI